jgi:organic radical activating enzyme
MYGLNKLSLIITTRCNLRCEYCCEYVPQNKPLPDMTVEEEERILRSAFAVFDHIDTLHLTGGGEPFLHERLAKMIEVAMRYSDRFDRLMLFTNCTLTLEPKLAGVLTKYKQKLFIQLSHYGVKPERERAFCDTIQKMEIPNRVRKYYGDEQAFGGWVDFGSWEKQNKSERELSEKFGNCACTNVLRGNWRTRDGKVHWCSRSQRGTELGLIPDNPNDYVDLLDNTAIEDKRAKFEKISQCKFISACDYCSGDQGTRDGSKRFAAAKQMEESNEG